MSSKDRSNIEPLISYGDVSISVNILELDVKPHTNKQKIQTHIFFYDGQWIGPHKTYMDILQCDQLLFLFFRM